MAKQRRQQRQHPRTQRRREDSADTRRDRLDQELIATRDSVQRVEKARRYLLSAHRAATGRQGRTVTREVDTHLETATEHMVRAGDLLLTPRHWKGGE